MLESLILNGRLEAAYHYHDANPRNFKEELLAHFHKGKRKEFMQLYLLLRNEQKLQFYLRVYFLIYSIHPTLKAKQTIPEEQINAFRDYLDNKGADLAKTNEFLQFYALPFVKNPVTHQSYKTLFKKEWVHNLTQKLHIFLDNEETRMKENAAKQTQSKYERSPEFVQPVAEASGSHLKTLEEKNRMLFEEVQAFKRKYGQLQKNHQALIEAFNSHLMQSQNKWFQITRELTNNSKTLIDLIYRSNSPLIQDRRYLRIKKRTQKFEKIVKKELDELLNQSQDLSVFDKPSNNQISYSAASVTPNVSQRNITTYVMMDEFVSTHYLALIRDFSKMADNEKIAVLKGLSWRIIKAKNKWVRRQTIVGLVVNDVLGLVNGDIQILLFNQHLMLHVARLFLFISQDSYGRKVLFRNGGLYKQLIDLIPQTLQLPCYQTLELILQTLLNIMHSPEILVQLLNLNLISLLINTLLDNQAVTTSDQLLQNCVTILLHAASNQRGLDMFEYEADVFYYLCQAFKEANDSNRNLVGAIVYQLLGRRKLWKVAHEAKLPQFITDLIAIDERSNKLQLKLIQARLHTFEPSKPVDSQPEEEASIDSDLQEENYERNEDELQDLQSYIKGHQMLTAKYPLRSPEAQQQLAEINRIINQDKTIIETVQQDPQPLHEQKGPQVKAKTKTDIKQKLNNVKLPQIKKRKEGVDLDNQKDTNKGQPKNYYSYKSPHFKHSQKNAYSVQVQSFEHEQPHQLQSFQQETEAVRNRVQTTKPHNNNRQAEKRDTKPEKRSVEKPDYRIKKSSSVEKGLGLGNHMRKEPEPFGKNPSNFAEQKSPQGFKSPPQKRSKQQVLKQLNQQLRAEKKAQDHKVSSKQHLPGDPTVQPFSRENTHVKKNNYMGVQEEARAFQSKPKLKRTPPKEDS